MMVISSSCLAPSAAAQAPPRAPLPFSFPDATAPPCPDGSHPSHPSHPSRPSRPSRPSSRNLTAGEGAPQGGGAAPGPRPGLTGYSPEILRSVWEFAAVIPGNDPELWRKDEFGDWIHRLEYGNRKSQFGWEVFDPGVGRHLQGVYAMRPMQWSSFLRQHETLDGW